MDDGASLFSGEAASITILVRSSGLVIEATAPTIAESEWPTKMHNSIRSSSSIANTSNTNPSNVE